MEHSHHHRPKNKWSKSKFRTLSIESGRIILWNWNWEKSVSLVKITSNPQSAAVTFIFAIVYNFIKKVSHNTHFLIISTTRFKSEGSAMWTIFFKSSVNIMFLGSITKSDIFVLNLSEKFSNCSLTLFLDWA